jgi:hypothetical protein
MRATGPSVNTYALASREWPLESRLKSALKSPLKSALKSATGPFFDGIFEPATRRARVRDGSFRSPPTPAKQGRDGVTG